jgi:hypothetical protein
VSGRPLGRPRQCPDEVLLLVVTRRVDGALLREIAVELNAAGVLTPGGKALWLEIHVSRLLRTDGGKAITSAVVASRAEREDASRQGGIELDRPSRRAAGPALDVGDNDEQDTVTQLPLDDAGDRPRPAPQRRRERHQMLPEGPPHRPRQYPRGTSGNRQLISGRPTQVGHCASRLPVGQALNGRATAQIGQRAKTRSADLDLRGMRSPPAYDGSRGISTPTGSTTTLPATTAAHGFSANVDRRPSVGGIRRFSGQAFPAWQGHDDLVGSAPDTHGPVSVSTGPRRE